MPKIKVAGRKKYVGIIRYAKAYKHPTLSRIFCRVVAQIAFSNTIAANLVKFSVF